MERTIEKIITPHTPEAACVVYLRDRTIIAVPSGADQPLQREDISALLLPTEGKKCFPEINVTEQDFPSDLPAIYCRKADYAVLTWNQALTPDQRREVLEGAR